MTETPGSEFEPRSSIRHRRIGLWGWIKQPFDISVGMWLFYVTLFSLSVATYLMPPYTVLTYMGSHVTWLWPALWVVGSLVGAVTVLQGWFIFERAGLLFIFGGSLLYLATAVEAQLSSDGNRWGQIAAMLIGMWFLWYRFRTIYLHDISPSK